MIKFQPFYTILLLTVLVAVIWAQGEYQAGPLGAEDCYWNKTINAYLPTYICEARCAQQAYCQGYLCKCWVNLNPWPHPMKNADYDDGDEE